MDGYIKRGPEWYGCVGNCYASIVEGLRVLIDEGKGAVPPDDRDGCVFVAADDAPAEVRRRLDPAYGPPVRRPMAAQ